MAWYAIDNPNDPQLDALAAQFHLHPLHIEDCRSQRERIKAESGAESGAGTGDRYIFLILKYVQSTGDGDLDLASIYLFVARDYLISVCDGSASKVNVLERARRAGAQENSAKLLYLILDTLVDSYFGFIDRNDERIDALEDNVIDNPAPEVLERLFEQKRELIELRRLLVNLRDATMSLQREQGSIIGPDLYPFFRDIYDHVLRLVDSVDMLRDLLNNTLDVYLSSVANRTNQVMKVLTVVSTISLPALVISGIYGMNLKGLPFLESDHGTEIVVGTMIALTGGLLWILRKYGWL